MTELYIFIVHNLHDEDQINFTDDVILGLGKTIQKKTQYAEAKSAVSELTGELVN